MSEGAAMQAQIIDERARISIGLTPEMNAEISNRAKETGMSMNRTIQQLLRAGIDAEHQKKQRLEEMLHRYRECADPKEAERLGNELGAMIFGR